MQASYGVALHCFNAHRINVDRHRRKVNFAYANNLSQEKEEAGIDGKTEKFASSQTSWPGNRTQHP